MPSPVSFSLLSFWPMFAALAVLITFVAILRSPSVKGWLGEMMVIRACLRKLDPTSYRYFNDLYLPRPDGGGTTQIDHVVVSPFGIFVLETKNYRGWIFGSARQLKWTQQIYHHRSRFQNPLHQNFLHVRALMKFLDLPQDHFKPVVFFLGDNTFKTPMPENVLNRGLLPWIRNHTAVLLDTAAIQQATARLEEASNNPRSRAVAREHVRALRARNAA